MPAHENIVAARDPLGYIRAMLSGRVAQALDVLGVKDAPIVFETPPDPKFGDLSTPVCMGLAKILKKNPRQIASDLQGLVSKEKVPYISKIEIAGPGYLNFFFDPPAFIKLVHGSIGFCGDKYGASDLGDGKKVIVEHTSTNPNKPIHLGTARCAILGDLTARVLRLAGYIVEVENYIDDLGRQVAVLLHGYRAHKDKVIRSPGDKDDYFLGLVYVHGANDVDDKEGGEEIVRDILHKMETPGTAENALAKDLVDKALHGQLQTLWDMNIFYDVLIWERHIVGSGLFSEAIALMMSRNPKACYKVVDGPDAGCIVLDMSSFGEKYTQDKKPYKILVRSNGVATYTGKDVAFQMWKFGEASGYFTYLPFTTQPNGSPLFTTEIADENTRKTRPDNHAPIFAHGDRVINVIGYEQEFPQDVVRVALKVLGFDEHYGNSQHLSFKHVWLPDQKFSGRAGTWVGFHADAAIDKAISKALDIITSQNPDVEAKQREDLARVIGTGAIKFYLSKFDLEKDITINWDDLLNFEGDACPYVQYSCVRAQSIINKAISQGIAIPDQDGDIDASLMATLEEFDLCKALAKLPSLVETVAKDLSINQVPQYALEVADRFNKFYHSCPVLRSDVPDGVRTARLMLVKDTIVVLKQVLDTMMGIEIPSKM
nr:arginine--tRNA ligase [Candidatus Sigynarchaeota archaeon]